MAGGKPMTERPPITTTRRWHPLRVVGWGTAAALLSLPLVAMQFTYEVQWDETDFLFAGLMFGGVGIVLELAVRMTTNAAYRAGVAVALAATFLLIWINLAVGVIGSEDNPANLMFGGVILIALVGAVAARFRAAGMARAMLAAAVAQALVAVIAMVGGHFAFVLIGGFVAMWLSSAWLFDRAARQRRLAG